MPFLLVLTAMPAIELERSDVERLVSVEKDVKYLVSKFAAFEEAQTKLGTEVTTVMQNHAIQLDREKRQNRLYSIAAGIIGGILPGLFGKH